MKSTRKVLSKIVRTKVDVNSEAKVKEEDLILPQSTRSVVSAPTDEEKSGVKIFHDPPRFLTSRDPEFYEIANRYFSFLNDTYTWHCVQMYSARKEDVVQVAAKYYRENTKKYSYMCWFDAKILDADYRKLFQDERLGRTEIPYNSRVTVSAVENSKISSSGKVNQKVCVYMPESKERTSDRKVIDGVRGWFGDRSHWLIVYDGVDSIEDIRRYIPTSRNGDILVIIKTLPQESFNLY